MCGQHKISKTIPTFYKMESKLITGTHEYRLLLFLLTYRAQVGVVASSLSSGESGWN